MTSQWQLREWTFSLHHPLQAEHEAGHLDKPQVPRFNLRYDPVDNRIQSTRFDGACSTNCPNLARKYTISENK